MSLISVVEASQEMKRQRNRNKQKDINYYINKSKYDKIIENVMKNN